MRMSKQIRISIAGIQQAVRRHPACALMLILGLIVFVVPFGLTSTAQSPAQPPRAPSAAARNAALVAATQEVLKETSEVRELSILRPVQSSTQSRAEIERAIIKNLDEDT